MTIDNSLNETHMRALRKDIHELRQLAVGTVEMISRVERNQAELKDDLTTIIKMEVIGLRGELERSLDDRFERLEHLILSMASSNSPNP